VSARRDPGFTPHSILTFKGLLGVEELFESLYERGQNYYISDIGVFMCLTHVFSAHYQVFKSVM
jgi:hypothetical protein